jgi:3-phosphoshikimate 1-carboxyvinyltransferase
MIQNLTIKPSKAAGTISASPSKSHSLRALLFASLAKGKSTIHHYLHSPDVDAMINACRKLGATIDKHDDHIDVIGFDAKPTTPDDIIDCGNSGQVLRFALAISTLCDGYSVFTGDHSIRFNRPMQPMVDGITGLNATCISTKNDGYAPIIIKGPVLPGKTTLDGLDSQPVSGLLMACAFSEGPFEIHVTNPGEQAWIDLTLDWFDRLSITYNHTHHTDYTVPGNSRISGFDYTVPGDFSSIAYPVAAALITHSNITITHVDMSDSQGDKLLIAALQSMGANITYHEALQTLNIQGGNTLNGAKIDMNVFIDAIPILAVIACYTKGTTHLYNAAIARTKECDRLHAMTVELKKMGADIEEHEDSLVIHESKLHGATLKSYHDHRIVMSLAMATLGASSSSTIHDTLCTAKSYPDFIKHMCSLGIAIEETT